MTKIILFDLDGVLTLAEEVFSVIYSRSRGYDVEPFTKFFTTEWSDFVTGKKDLKQHIEDNNELWKWDGSPDELLKYWFESVNIKNESLLTVVKNLRREGIKCYIATEQERYRTDYIRRVMFKDEFDGIFSTAEIGYKKNNPRFFENLVNTLGISAESIVYFDDSQSKLDAAKIVGLDSYLYTNVDDVERVVASNDFSS